MLRYSGVLGTQVRLEWYSVTGEVDSAFQNLGHHRHRNRFRQTTQRYVVFPTQIAQH